eukprot:scaffold284983_cov34-Tisochrysis_lutea.AAC.3
MNSPSSGHCFGDWFSGASRSTSTTHSRTDSLVRPGESAMGGEIELTVPTYPVSSRSSVRSRRVIVSRVYCLVLRQAGMHSTSKGSRSSSPLTAASAAVSP